MEALLAEYGSKNIGLSQHDKVEGTILSIDSSKVVIDIGGKSEGIVAEKAFQEAQKFISTLKVGQKITAHVLVPETNDGFVILSLRQASQEAAWEKIEKAYKDDETLSVFGKSANNSGIVVDIYGLTGFVPQSQLGHVASKDMESLVGRHFEVKVLDADRKEDRVVLSEREVTDAEEIAQAKKAFAKLEIGQVYEGKVTSIYDFGCFVAIPVKVDKEEVAVEGLVHISELSWEKVGRAKDAAKVGEKVKVKVIGIDKKKLALSIKQTQEDPWEKVEKAYKVDSKHTGTVVKNTDYGIVVSLESGVEGLVHMTKVPPGQSYEKGDSINVYIEDVDTQNHKIGLGIVLTAKPVGYR